MDLSDRQLLEHYLRHRDEAAFAALVHRYLGFVHGVAVRITANEELARDVAQSTFIRLAERAALIPPSLPLPSWLHRVVRGLSIDLVRTESRRKEREANSRLMNSPEFASAEPDWSALAPMIDSLVAQLPAADRDMILLRFFRKESHAGIAAHFGVTEQAARKRFLRALEKLRVLLAKRGISTSAAALASMLPAHAAAPIPPGLATAICIAAQSVIPATPGFLTSSFLSVTSAQKSALAASLALLLSATAYTISPSPQFEAASAAPPLDPSTTSDPDAARVARSRLHHKRTVPLTSQERLERLKEIISLPKIDPRRDAELIAYLDEMPPDLFPETAGTLMDHSTQEDELVLLTLSDWSKSDPAAALNFLGSRGSFRVRLDDEVLYNWALTDLNAASQWVSNLPSTPNNDLSRYFRINSLLKAALIISPSATFDIVNSQPTPELQKRALSCLGGLTTGRRDLEKQLFALAPASQLPMLIGAATSVDLSHGIDLLREHPEAATYADIEQIYNLWAGQNLDEAIDSAAALSEPAARKRAASAIIDGRIQTGLSQALYAINGLSDEATDDHLSHFVKAMAPQDPEIALDQIPKLSNSGERAFLTAQVLNTWQVKDPATARNWIKAHPQPSAVTDRLSFKP